MLGAGTRMATIPSEPPALCLDLTRTIRRADQTATGIDRVELAYLDRLLSDPRPVFGLVTTQQAHLILTRPGLAAVQTGLWPRAAGLSMFFRRQRPDQRRAFTLVRRHAIARTPDVLPKGTLYLNVGHSNLTDRTLTALSHCTRQVLIHDTIPLDLPQLHHPDTVTRLRARLTAATRHADRIICVSDEACRQLHAHFPQAQTKAIPIGAPPLPQGPRPDWAQPPYALAIGRIEPRKNPELLCKAWDLLPDNGPNLYLCGPQTQPLTPPPGVHIQENLDDATLGAALTHAHALLFPSQAEGFALPPREAAAIGVPVLACDTQPMRSLLGEFPVYLPPNDPYAWARAVHHLCQTQQPPRLTPVAPPTWDAHFKSALTL